MTLVAREVPPGGAGKRLPRKIEGVASKKLTLGVIYSLDVYNDETHIGRTKHGERV